MIATPQPLYQQVQDVLTSWIADGKWRAGESLPSEFALAGELGVSQGTVRKALNEMAGLNLIERQQGRGTFVPEHTEARALFHFFRMTGPDGAAIVPEPVWHDISLVDPAGDVARLLGTGRRKIWCIERLRGVAGHPAIVEFIYLDPKRFSGLKPGADLPNALYSYYQSQAGISVVRAEDRLTAEAADKPLATRLKVPEKAPLLAAHRVAFDVRGTAVEVRQSWFRTDLQGYSVNLK